PPSTPADFRNVTTMVFIEALYKAQTVLLEPLHVFELKIPQNALSKAVCDLETMRATFDNTIVIGDEFSIKGLIPVE
ncbi:tetracycline resistance ribosomal protection protein TetB(P), partial [Clostridium perfringens]